ncbi:MAG: AMP-binding protein, partial [Albidovulum sp.]
GMTDPDAVALINGATGQEISAGQLIAEVKSLAGGFVERGFGRGDCLALMAPNVPEFFTVFHGAAWAGASVTTVNPAYTAREVNHQLVDSKAGLLVTVPALLETARAAIEGTAVREIVVIGTVPGATPLSSLMGPPLAQQAPINAGEDVAALPYSSGTTGLPKGVMLTHRNLVVNVDQCQGVVQIKPGEVTPAFLPFFHIYGLEVLLHLYLAAGARLVTMERFDLETFLQMTQDHQAERLWLVPPVAIALAKHPMVDQFDLSCLRQVNSAAAPLGADLSAAVGERLGCHTTQAYGMTELSPASHIMHMADVRPGSAGQTVAGTSCRIVDVVTGADLGPDEEGELWISGPQVMKGYLNNEAATASTIDDEGWLKTGDIACFDKDGFLYIRDRLKELIKFKGFQIAPAEIEAEILTHPAVADAAVIGIDDDEAGEVPLAFVVITAGAALSEAELMRHLEGRLASYKRVRSFRFVETIPKSASGKILRRVLRSQLGL